MQITRSIDTTEAPQLGDGGGWLSIVITAFDRPTLLMIRHHNFSTHTEAIVLYVNDKVIPVLSDPGRPNCRSAESSNVENRAYRFVKVMR